MPIRPDVEPGSYTRKFRIMLAMISPPGGGEWGPTKMKRVTNGRIGASYYNSLRDGHVDIPRADKIEAIAVAMNFPPELWFKSLEWWQRAYSKWERGEDISAILDDEEGEPTRVRISKKLNALFDLKPASDSGEQLSNLQVSEKSGGVLSPERLAQLRAAQFDTVSQDELAVLGAIFEVGPLYWSEEAVPWRESPQGLEDLMDPESYETMQNSMSLSKHNRGMLRNMSKYLKWQQKNEKSS